MVEINVVTMISEGFFEPAAALMDITVAGINCTHAEFITRNMTIEFVALVFLSFSFWSSSIALMPKGVAAFDSPSILEAIFMTIALIAGCLEGRSGKKTLITGVISFPIILVRPDFSAIFIMPHQRQITPISPIVSSTAEDAPLMAAAVAASVLPLRKDNSSAENIIKNHITLIIQSPLNCCT